MRLRQWGGLASACPWSPGGVQSGKLPAQRLASGQLQIAEADLAAFLPLRDAAPRAMPADAAVALAVAQERIRGLEEMVSLEREWRTMAEERLALVQASLPAPPVQETPPRSRRWFWPWGKG